MDYNDRTPFEKMVASIIDHVEGLISQKQREAQMRDCEDSVFEELHDDIQTLFAIRGEIESAKTTEDAATGISALACMYSIPLQVSKMIDEVYITEKKRCLKICSGCPAERTCNPELKRIRPMIESVFPGARCSLVGMMVDITRL